MDRDAALAALTDMVAAESRPTLSTETLGRLLDAATVADRDGRQPTDPEWVPTWHLDYAAAEGWRLKAGKVAGDFSFSADGASYQKADVLANCLAMEAKYAARCHGVIRVVRERSRLDHEWDGTQVP